MPPELLRQVYGLGLLLLASLALAVAGAAAHAALAAYKRLGR